MTILPDDSQVKWHVADNIREETANKLSLLGYYSDNKMLVKGPLPTSNTPLLIESLNLLWVFTDGEGTFNARVEILDPQNEPIIAVPSQTFTINQNSGSNLIVKLIPFIIRKLGAYTCNAILNDRAYSRKFEVNLQG